MAFSRRGMLFFVFVALINASFVAAEYRKPLSSDEMWYVIAADTYAKTGILRAEATSGSTPFLYHTPLFPILAGVTRVFFDTPESSRIVGIVCGFLSLLLLYLVGRRLDNTGLRGGIAVLLLCLNPAFIHASIVVDIDNTLIPVLLLTLTWTLVEMRWSAFSVAFCLSLWSKFVATVPIAGLLFFYAICRLVKKDTPQGLGILRGLAIGSALFAASFWLYCWAYGLPFADPFIYALRSLSAKKVGPGNLGVTIVEFTLWFGPSLIMLWLTAIAYKPLASVFDRIATMLSLGITAGYMFVGGMTFGYPKYHLPVLALVCWLASRPIAEAIQEHGPRWAYKALLGVVLATVITMIAGDPILTLRYSIREALFNGYGAKRQAVVLAFQVALPLALGMILWRIWPSPSARKSVAFAGAFGVLCVGQSLGMDILQMRPYNTTYTYGSTGLIEATHKVEGYLTPDCQMALPLEMTGYLALRGHSLRQVDDLFWSDEEAIVSATTSPEWKVICYGVTSNTISQLKLLKGDRVSASFVSNGWKNIQIGSYEIWTR